MRLVTLFLHWLAFGLRQINTSVNLLDSLTAQGQQGSFYVPMIWRRGFIMRVALPMSGCEMGEIRSRGIDFGHLAFVPLESLKDGGKKRKAKTSIRLLAPCNAAIVFLTRGQVSAVYPRLGLSPNLRRQASTRTVVHGCFVLGSLLVSAVETGASLFAHLPGFPAWLRMVACGAVMEKTVRNTTVRTKKLKQVPSDRVRLVFLCSFNANTTG
ncbi:hypothetical protein IF1G_01057 [Cordyceps javanica]|uniref:Secreted protein n=1 Tax=Cordyceps javanica TaxID=43265 RepID=A0A545VHJ5_9HYPO|nr:hypothetical protein IF1G_01057 [Cordyceps javanica]